MSEWTVSTPPRLPVPAAALIGRTLHIPSQQCRYRDTDLVLVVTRVRDDISLWYGGDWVWLQGDEVDDHGVLLGWTTALVHVTACTTGRP